MKFKQLGLVGCGLMGASFALALQEKQLVDKVVGFSPSQATRDKALQRGVIQQAVGSAAEAVQGADLVLIAVPVSHTAACLLEIAPHLHADALVMDVGSTKTDVVAAARAALGDKLGCFLPAHPIAGKAQAGVAHADASLYQDRALILTPLAHNTPAQIATATALWQAIGSRVHSMTPEAHDQTFAAVSHVPHLLAFAQVNGLLQQPQATEFLKLAGPGFRDFSRIAAGDPAIWRDIFLANAQQVLTQTTHFRIALEQLEAAITQGDAAALEALISRASQARSAWQLGEAASRTDQNQRLPSAGESQED
jgi:prephenate dehydrogenase